MKERMILLMLALAGMFLTAGCQSLFPRNETTDVLRWKTYKDVETAFGKIEPDCTTVEELQTMGFDPKVTPNVKILTYVDLIVTFLPSPAIRLEDLPDGVRDCIQARENSKAYLVELHVTKDKRHGNLFLDIFGFKRLTHTSGWEFKGLILIKDNLVVYKLASGEPKVSRDQTNVKPLGPLQEIDSLITGPASYAK